MTFSLITCFNLTVGNLKIVLCFLNTKNHQWSHSTLFKSDSTRFGISSEAVVPVWRTSSWRSLCCLGPNCWIMSGSKSLMVLVSDSPETMKVLFWIEAYAYGLTKCNTVLSSLKKLISSTPNCWAPIFLTMFLTTLSLPPWNKIWNYSCWLGDDFNFSSLRALSSSSGVSHLASQYLDVSSNFLGG